MSIISSIEEDHSDIVCKLYAQQALAFLDEGRATGETSGVPLANLFRLFEMYRYDAFDDERRAGVLALAEFQKSGIKPPNTWYARIKDALDQAVHVAFGNEPRDAAVEELQSVLRQLSKSQLTAQAAELERHKAFYKEFSAALPA